MVRRHHQIEFASGALVFPGGKVDPGDADPAWEDHALGWAEIEPAERALRVCAVREAFEESGMLIARHAGDATWNIGARGAGERSALAAGHCTFLDLVSGLGLKLDLGAMTLFARWITPAALNKRFDTYFYLMTAPSDQLAACDGCETVDAEWIAPAEALRLQQTGERTIVYPTRLNLALLAESGSVADAIARTRERRIVPIEPSLDKDGETLWISIPPDVGYGVVARQSL
jgi:8-oxo-dGTP pyrophosphatase MutT (NUDIX family)